MTEAFLTLVELDRLEELLDSEVFADGTMRLDEIQAFLCAVVSGPVAVVPEDWLGEILGGGEGSQDRAEVSTRRSISRRGPRPHASSADGR